MEHKNAAHAARAQANGGITVDIEGSRYFSGRTESPSVFAVRRDSSKVVAFISAETPITAAKKYHNHHK